MTIKVVGESVDDQGNAVILAEGVFEVPVSGNRLAELFWLMTDEEQAAFFNSLYELSERNGYNFNMQLAYIAAHLTSRAFSTCKGVVSGGMTCNSSTESTGIDTEEFEELGL